MTSYRSHSSGRVLLNVFLNKEIMLSYIGDIMEDATDFSFTCAKAHLSGFTFHTMTKLEFRIWAHT